MALTSLSYAVIGILAALVALGGAMRLGSGRVTMPPCSSRSFQNYTAGAGVSKIQITPDNTAFASDSGTVLAVRHVTGGMTIMSLVFARDDTCIEESSVMCADLPTESEVLLADSELAPTEAPVATLSHSLSMSSVCKLPCVASSEPVISYFRTMLSGAFYLRGSKDIPKVLSVGLGAGALPLWFAGRMPETSFTAVDINEDVVHAAPCFGLTESENMHLIMADGIEYLKQSQESFDVIFVDVFDGENMPKQFATVDFFEAVRKRLSEDGVLVWDLHDEDVPTCVALAKKFFNPDTVYLGLSPGLSNKILVAGLQEEGPPDETEEVRFPQEWTRDASWRRAGEPM